MGPYVHVISLQIQTLINPRGSTRRTRLHANHTKVLVSGMRA